MNETLRGTIFGPQSLKSSSCRACHLSVTNVETGCATGAASKVENSTESVLQQLRGFVATLSQDELGGSVSSH